jgi:hypothetical protein
MTATPEFPSVCDGNCGLVELPRRDPAAEAALELQGDGDRDVVSVAAGGDLHAERQVGLVEAERDLGDG